MTPPAINGMSPPGMQNGGGSMNGYAMTGQHSGSGQDKYRYRFTGTNLLKKKI